MKRVSKETRESEDQEVGTRRSGPEGPVGRDQDNRAESETYCNLLKIHELWLFKEGCSLGFPSVSVDGIHFLFVR